MSRLYHHSASRLVSSPCTVRSLSFACVLFVSRYEVTHTFLFSRIPRGDLAPFVVCCVVTP